jgi:Skp family chaperone for outer membrane proteins
MTGVPYASMVTRDRKSFLQPKSKKTWSQIMPSLNQACKQLRIGRIKLFDYLEKLGIEPALVGNTKQISDQHIEHISLAIQKDSTPVEIKAEQGQLNLENKSEHFQNHFGNSSRSIPQIDLRLFEQMNEEIDHLKQMLAEEKAERKAEREERTNYQTMLAALQQNNQRLQQENNRLQLEMLDEPKRQEVHFGTQREDSTNSVGIEEPSLSDITVPQGTSRGSGRTFGIGLSIAAIFAVLFYAAISNGQGGGWLPTMQKISTTWEVGGRNLDNR